MIHYLIRRLLLIPLTLFAIILVNFVILNLAPGDPANQASLGVTGEATRSNKESGSVNENQYLQFREHYGLTLPILFNTWPSLSTDTIEEGLQKLTYEREQLSVQKYHELRTLWGDRARFVMPKLLGIASDPSRDLRLRKTALNLFVRGGIRQGHVGATLSSEKRAENRRISSSNLYLTERRASTHGSVESFEEKVGDLISWYERSGGWESFTWRKGAKVKAFFFETRLLRYLGKVLTLDFGTLRNDANKTVISEVGKRMKYSLTLAVVPMFLTFALCQLFGMLMATRQNQWPDYSFNVLFLVLFAIPIFVVAPFLIEKIALNKTIPFTQISIPYSGFHSSEATYSQLTSPKRLADTFLHLFLPLVAIMYGTLAIQSRLSRTAFLEVLRQDYVKAARARGLSRAQVLIKHVGRNGAITIVTSLAASLGVILGGSLIVETIFEINGFGRFFYEAILNRDFNVVLFSAFAGSFLTLIGYLAADIAYTVLDPRVNLQ